MIADVSLVVIHYGDVDLTHSLVNTLNSHPDSALISEIIIVDNGEHLKKDEVETLRDLGVQEIIPNDDASYACGVNTGVQKASYEYIIISNNDIEWIEGESIEPLLSTIMREEVGVAGPQQVYPSGTWERSSGLCPSVPSGLKSVFFVDTLKNIGSKLAFDNDIWYRTETEYIDGAFMMIDSNCYNDVGGFDESFEFYGEEADFCLRARREGWKIVRDTRARIMHIRGATSSSSAPDKYARNLEYAKLQLVEKHYGIYHRIGYRYLRTIALLERIILYSILGKLFNDTWNNRENAARKRFNSIRGGQVNKKS